MLPPTIISLPFKVLFFVLIDEIRHLEFLKHVIEEVERQCVFFILVFGFAFVVVRLCRANNGRGGANRYSGRNNHLNRIAVVVVRRVIINQCLIFVQVKLPVHGVLGLKYRKRILGLHHKSDAEEQPEY